MKHRNMTFPFFFQKRAQSILIAAGALFFVLALILVQSAHGQDTNASPNPSPTPEEPPAKSTVRGKVVYEDTGRPVRRARIYLFGTDGKSGSGVNALTDNNGEFEIKNVRQGKYFAMVNSPGVLTPFGFADGFEEIEKYPEKEFFDRVKEAFEEFSVDGTSDKKIEVKAKRGGAINGKVTYSNGDPAVSVRVSVLRKKGEKLLPVMTGLNASIFSGTATDDRGIYRIAGLPSGEYLISVSEPSSHNGKNSSSGDDGLLDSLGFAAAGSFLITYYPDANAPENAASVKVSLGQEQDDINIIIADRELHKISGKVIARSDKSPVKGATVILKKKGNKIKSIFTEKEVNNIRTDEQGNWSFQELPDGVYTITVESLSESEPEYDDKGEYKGTKFKRQLAGKKQEVNLLDSDKSDVVFELSDGGSISGTVTLASGKPVSSVYVRAESVAADKSDEDSDNPYRRDGQSGYVESDGKFTISSLPAGAVYLSVDWYSENSNK